MSQNKRNDKTHSSKIVFSSNDIVLICLQRTLNTLTKNVLLMFTDMFHEAERMMTSSSEDSSPSQRSTRALL